MFSKSLHLFKRFFSFRMIRMESRKKKKADMLSSAIGVFQMQTPCRAAVGLQSSMQFSKMISF